MYEKPPLKDKENFQSCASESNTSRNTDRTQIKILTFAQTVKTDYILHKISTIMAQEEKNLFKYCDNTVTTLICNFLKFSRFDGTS